MTTGTLEKTYRMDVRLTQPQRKSYERAASLKGQTLSQWTTVNLDACARRDIEESTQLRLSEDDFELFCRILDEPLPQAAAELLAREDAWA